MPRVANEGEAVDQWYQTTGEPNGEGSSYWDLCNKCNEDPEHALTVLEPYNGDPRGDELAEVGFAPCYEDSYQMGEPKTCEVCGEILRRWDN
jgi:hypothetical protein